MEPAQRCIQYAAVFYACGLALFGCTRTPVSAADEPGRVATRQPPPAPHPSLHARVRLVVLHTLGGPDYGRPQRRWTFMAPRETFALWKHPSFGAHWIVWIDGSIWPRHPAEGEPESFLPPASDPASGELAERLAQQAEPVLSHVEGANRRSLGIELAHSGRSGDPFPPEQVRSLRWLLRSLFELSGGRLGVGSVVGHKDLDRQPAWVPERCQDRGCPTYADPEGRAYRRRVDPPERLFAALAGQGLVVPRANAEGDAELLRAMRIPGNSVPASVPAAAKR